MQTRRLVAALRTAFGRPKGSRDGDSHNALRTATAIEASHSLLAIWRADSERIEAFLAEDGGVVIVELLQEPCSEQVRHACNKSRCSGVQCVSAMVSPVHTCATWPEATLLTDRHLMHKQTVSASRHTPNDKRFGPAS